MSSLIKDNHPLTSIIVPSYNHEKYIIDCLDSIKEDEYPNKQLIIIDDGSTDTSVRLINDWVKLNRSDSLEIYFRSRENKGLCFTLNELVQIANGKYIIILASDDMLIKNTILPRVLYLEQNPNKLVLVSDAIVVDQNNITQFSSMLTDFHSVDKTNYHNEQLLLDEIVFNFSISGAVVIANKYIYNLIGKYPENLKAEDLYFYIKCACINKISFFDLKVSKYRLHVTNTSGFNPSLTKTIIKTYLMTFFLIPGFKRRFKIIKRIIGLYLINIILKKAK